MALKLLFGVPLLAGVLITSLDVFIVLFLQGRGFRLIEGFVVTLIATIGACFAYEIFFSRPLWIEAAHGFIPHLEILRNKEMLYIAIGILGATVMPHNLYLHSSIVQTRAFGDSSADRREAIKYAIIDSTVALGFALFINAAILVLGAAAFHTRGLNEVADISEAYKLLTPLLGCKLRQHSFCLCIAGFRSEFNLDGNSRRSNRHGGFPANSSQTMDSPFGHPFHRDSACNSCDRPCRRRKSHLSLILSQVVLSFQLPFAVIPLVQFTSERAKMGEFVNSRATVVVAWVVAAGILFFNAELLWLIFRA